MKRSVLIQQAIVVPIVAWLFLVVLGVFVPGYSSVSKDVSALGLLSGPVAVIADLAMIVNGASVALFGICLIRDRSGRYTFTAPLMILLGVCAMFSGFFKWGARFTGFSGSEPLCRSYRHFSSRSFIILKTIELLQLFQK